MKKGASSRIARKLQSVMQVVEAPVKVVAPAPDGVAPVLPVVNSPMSQGQTERVMKDLLVDGWPIRRRLMIMALLFCAGNVQYLLLWGQDTSLNKEIATTLLWVGGAIIGSYVFGAVWDDMDRRDTMLEYDTSYTPIGTGGAAPQQLDGGG